MCIAILTKPGAVISDANLRQAHSSNRDGGGMAFIRDDKVVIEKGFMAVEDFISRYHQVIEEGLHKDNPMLVHFRIATTGEVGPANCHPFPIGENKGDGALIHNGSFYGGRTNAEKSDTRVLAERLTSKFLYEPTLFAKQKIEEKIGSYNKVVLLYNTGDYIILNEHQGGWKDDIWYSNHWFAGRAYSNPTNNCPIPLTRGNPGADI